MLLTVLMHEELTAREECSNFDGPAGSPTRSSAKLGKRCGKDRQKSDMLRTASSLQQRFSIMASASAGQRLPQGSIAAFHMPTRHLVQKRKQGATLPETEENYSVQHASRQIMMCHWPPILQDVHAYTAFSMEMIPRAMILTLQSACCT
jgi:hypothetical protein